MSAGLLSPRALARRFLLRGPLRASALALCLAGVIAFSWALPLGTSTALRSGLRASLSDRAQLTVERAQVMDFEGFTAFEREAAAAVEPRVGRYLAPADTFATVGPMTPVSVDDQPYRSGATHLDAAYRDGLAPHVEFLAGQLPPDGLGGPAPAVTMPVRGADQLGLRLSDRFCLDLAPAGQTSSWCGRLVGLWRPVSEADPYWAGRPPRLEVVLGRYDFFQLLQLRPPQGAVAGRRYAADPLSVEPAIAGDLAGQLHDLRASFPGGGPMRLSMSLDVALGRYDAAQQSAALNLNVMTTLMALLGLCLVGLTARGVVDLQAPDVALLRAHGWPAGAAWRFLFAQLGAILLVALPVALVGAALFTAALGLWAPAGAGPAYGNLSGPGADVAGVLAAAVVLLAAMAWSVARRQPGQDATLARRAGGSRWRWSVDVLLAGLALALALVPARLDGLGGLPDPAGGALRFIAPVTAAALLGLVGLRGLPAVGSLVASRSADLASALAGWQLGRRPGQHAGLVLLEALASGCAGFGAVSLAIQPQAVAQLDAIQHGFDAVVGAVVIGTLATGVSGAWLHFQAAARARRREYGALALHGLPPATARRSLGIEQLAVLGYAMGAGTLLALTLAAAAGQEAGSGLQPEPGHAPGALAAWLALPAGLALVGWIVRRASFRGGVLAGLRWAP